MNTTSTTITVERSVAIREGLDLERLKAFYAKRNIIIEVVEDVELANRQDSGVRLCEKCDKTQKLDGVAWTRRVRADGQLSTWRRYCATCTNEQQSNPPRRSGTSLRRRAKPIYKNPKVKTSAPSAKECRHCHTDVVLTDFPLSPNGRRLWVCQPCLDKMEIERTCRICQEMKPADRFERHPLSLGGRRRECRDCIKARRKAVRAGRTK